MPTYVFACPCGKTEERFLRVSELEEKRPVCHGPMETIIQPVAGFVQMECRYKCVSTNEEITSWKQRKENFARHGFRDASDDNPEKQIAKMKKKQADDAALAAQMPGNYGDVYPL